MEQIKFKPFDRIIVKRNDGISNTKLWTCFEFSHYDENYIATVGGNEYDSNVYEILPYEGNENLVGTNDSPAEYIKLEEGEVVVVFDCIYEFENFIFSISKYNNCTHTQWKYFIPFSKFNPNDLEANKKEILKVENGKIVKAVV